MKARILFLSLLLVAVVGVHADDKEKKPKTETVRVLKFDPSTKPSAAINTGRWETRTIDKDDPSSMCMSCNHSRPVSTDKPAILPKRSEAYLCSHCHNVVYLDDGKEVAYKDKVEEEALKRIKKQLKQKDTTTKPAAAVNVGK